MFKIDKKISAEIIKLTRTIRCNSLVISGSLYYVKKDERLKSSGRIISFCFDGIEFETEPKTYFYNWLYINALHLHESYTEHMLGYDAFTDIEFNPQKSVNCQAEAAAVYVSLRKQGLLEEALKNKDSFKEIVYMQNI